MNIGFVIPSFLSGGAERAMSILCNEFVQRGHDVSLYLTEDAENIFYTLDKRIRIVDITINDDRNYALKVPSYIKKLSKDIKGKRLDVVISFITRTNIISICACKMAGIPVIVSERNNPYLVPANPWWRRIRDFIYNYADGAVFQSFHARDYFSSRVVLKSVVIKNPMTETVNADFNYDDKQNRIVCVCRLEPQKNVPLLINAFHKIYKDIPQYTLHIYGEGGMYQELKVLIEKYGLDSVAFLEGNTNEAIQKIASAKIFVLSSDFEGLSNAVMEAMCVGTACVVTDSPTYGNREIISSGYDGFLVPCNDLDALADKIKMLACDEALNRKISENARRLYEKTNSKEIAKQWEDFINKTIYSFKA